MSKKWVYIFLIVVIVGSVLAYHNYKYSAPSSQTVGKCVVVLDPGHGGEDPGKVGVHGELEKDINLQIALLVKEELEKANVEVLMTRTDDNVPNHKLEDMKKRVAFINEQAPVFVVSIHQNSYTDSGVKGPQVFYYSKSKEGQAIALFMQKQLNSLDESHKRQAKGNDSYYLLLHTKVPTIIVECGFLSNAEEAKKLTTKEYQQILAKAISEGIQKKMAGNIDEVML